VTILRTVPAASDVAVPGKICRVAPRAVGSLYRRAAAKTALEAAPTDRITGGT